MRPNAPLAEDASAAGARPNVPDSFDGGLTSGGSANPEQGGGGSSHSNDSGLPPNGGAGGSAGENAGGSAGQNAGGSAGEGSGGSAGQDSGGSTGSECVISNGGVESCDGLDNDCSGSIDELGCPATCRGVSISGNGYMFCDIEIPWNEAKSSCESQGLHLIKVDDAAEDAAVSAEAYSSDTKFYWIGASRDAVNGWSWTDGSPLTYTNWRLGEPSEPCVQVDTEFLWRTIRCGQAKRYVCERSF